MLQKRFDRTTGLRVATFRVCLTELEETVDLRNVVLVVERASDNSDSLSIVVMITRLAIDEGAVGHS